MKNFPKFFGKVPVGSKGQIVIPAEARKAMNIKSGDSVIVMSGPAHHGRMIKIVAADEFNRFLKHFEDHVVKMKRELSDKDAR